MKRSALSCQFALSVWFGVAALASAAVPEAGTEAASKPVEFALLVRRGLHARRHFVERARKLGQLILPFDVPPPRQVPARAGPPRPAPGGEPGGGRGGGGEAGGGDYRRRV